MEKERVLSHLGEGSKVILLPSDRSNRRRYYDPKDGTWTSLLPAGPFEKYYCRKGFRLVAPDGSGPPDLERSKQ